MFKTIRSKITALYVLTFGITLVVFSIVLYVLYDQKSRSDFDLVLENDALTAANSLKEGGLFGAEMLSRLTESALSINFARDEYIEILSFDGRVIAKSRNLQENFLPLRTELLALALNGQQVLQTLTADSRQGPFWGGGDLRLVAMPIADIGIPQYIIAVGMSTASLERALWQLRLMLFIAIPLTLLVASLSGLLLAKRAFDPIDRIIHTTRSITADQLDKRLEVQGVDDEINRLSKTLNEMMDRLEKSFQSQRQFTADASHELRTPLTILKGEMEVALQQKRERSEYEETIRSAIEEIRRINKIVDDLLTLARLDAGQLPIHREPLRLDELLMDTVAKATAAAQKKNITIGLDVLDAGRDKEEEELIIAGDRDKLINVFLNLLNNAINYSENGKDVYMTVGAEGKMAVVQIKDNGIGIPPEDLPHIFDRFYRADKSRSHEDIAEASGTGLGLSIAKWIVEAHQGTIAAESTVGKGTTVTVRLPQVQQA